MANLKSPQTSNQSRITYVVFLPNYVSQFPFTLVTAQFTIRHVCCQTHNYHKKEYLDEWLEYNYANIFQNEIIQHDVMFCKLSKSFCNRCTRQFCLRRLGCQLYLVVRDKGLQRNACQPLILSGIRLNTPLTEMQVRDIVYRIVI